MKARDAIFGLRGSEGIGGGDLEGVVSGREIREGGDPLGVARGPGFIAETKQPVAKAHLLRRAEFGQV